MKKFTVIFVGVLFVTAMPGASKALEAGRVYLSLKGEYIASSSSDVELTSSGVDVPGDADYEDGFGGGGIVGYNFTENIRGEVEASYRENEVKVTTFSGGNVSDDDVDIKILSGMVNAYYNFDTGTAFSPYVGGGLGVAGLGIARDTDDDIYAFAYQGMVGVDYNISRRHVIFAGYRYFGTGDFEGSYDSRSLGEVDAEADIRSNIIEVGYRFVF